MCCLQCCKQHVSDQDSQAVPVHGGTNMRQAVLFAEELKQFCLMLHNSDEAQTGWLVDLQKTGEQDDIRIDLRSLLSTASGRPTNTPLAALRSVGRRVCTDINTDLQTSSGDVVGQPYEDEMAEEVDLCRFGQEMSTSQLFGEEGDALLSELKKKPCPYNIDAVRRHRLTTIKVNNVEVEVRFKNRAVELLFRPQFSLVHTCH